MLNLVVLFLSKSTTYVAVTGHEKSFVYFSIIRRRNSKKITEKLLKKGK